MKKVVDEIYPTVFGGRVKFSSPLELEEVGKLIGEKLFAGLVFEGLDMNIHDEVPTILIIRPVMGIRFWISQDYDTDPNIRFYTLGCRWRHLVKKPAPYTPVRLDVYLRSLLMESFPEGNGLIHVD